VISRGDGARTSGPDRDGPGWDLIDGDDVIGTASARLLSTCADRGERLAALSLLGLLLDHADETGRVRLPLEALARELDVEDDRAVRLLQYLVAVDAVHAEGDAVVVAGASSAENALAPSRFLANLMTVLEREPASATPTPARSTGETGAALTRREAPRHRVLAALGVAVAAMALATAPVGDVDTSLRTVATPGQQEGRAPWATVTRTPTTAAPPLEEGSATPDDPASPSDDAGGHSARPGAPAARSGDEPPDATGDTPDGGGQAARPPVPAPSDPQRSSERPATQPLPPRPPPAVITPDPPATPPDRGVRCPSGAPRASTSNVEFVGAGPSNVLDVVGERRLRATGTVVNASDAAVTVSTVEVRIGTGTDPNIHLVSPVPTAIRPGGTAIWEATSTTNMTNPPAQLSDLVEATVTEWSWSDLGLAASCPT
jgi:hypothetical protein